jgi:hypothetical protein
VKKILWSEQQQPFIVKLVLAEEKVKVIFKDGLVGSGMV